MIPASFMLTRVLVAILVLVCAPAVEVCAQGGLSGHVSVTADYLPNRNQAAELRARVFVEERLEPSMRVRLTLSGFVEGLLARRPEPSPFGSSDPGALDSRGAAIARVQDANVELGTDRV